MFVTDFYEWVDRITKKADKDSILKILKVINRTKRLLEQRINERKMI